MPARRWRPSTGPGSPVVKMPAVGRASIPGPMIRGKRLPTTDLYFADACAGLLQRWHRPGPIRALGPNSFATGDVALVVRAEHPEVVGRILSRKWKRLIYLIDDDIEAGLDDPGLPAAYRLRLRHLYTTQYRPILHSADVIVTGSECLRRKYGAMKQAYRIDPYWPLPLADPGHFDSLSGDGTVRLVHLGTASHRPDLEAILPALERAMSRLDRLELTVFYRFPELERLARRHRIRIRRHRGWSRHKRELPRQRYHLALYPLRNTAFNRARSLNKLMEHTVAGAVGIYGADWSHAELIEDTGNGFVAGEGAWEWEAALERALSLGGRLRGVFERARATAARHNDRDAQLRFWTRMFEL